MMSHHGRMAEGIYMMRAATFHNFWTWYLSSCQPHIKLSNVQVVWFPPNTTCESHPVDQGVTNCTKLNYCQLLMWSLLANCCHWTCKVHTIPWCNHLISRGVKASVSTHTVPCFQKASLSTIDLNNEEAN
jgi:DDE superfamily endonuclease.